MVPDPQCASCHGSFVEKIENESDDPREFHQHGAADFEPDNFPPGIDTFLLSLQDMMDRGSAEERRRPQPEARSHTPPGPNPGVSERGFRFEMRTGSGNGARTFTVGGPNTLSGMRSHGGSRERDEMPTIFLRSSPAPEGQERAGITGPIMAQYLMALLGQRNGGLDPLAGLFGLGMNADATERGRWGDYVFNQEALDQIISQLMENSNSHRPVPATDEIISNLPREVLEEGSPALQKDCAVCKEQFSTETEDPNEHVVVTLPCKHPFHEGCITPWLTSSGTCPVCRYALVPQPDQHPSGPGAGQSSGPASSPPPQPQSRSVGSGAGEGGNLLSSLFSYIGSGSGTGGNGGAGQHGGRGDRRRPGRARPSDPDIPGGWADQVD